MDIENALYVSFWLIFYVVILVGFLSGLGYFIFKRIQRKSESKKQYNLTFLKIRLPKDNEVEIKAAEQMFAGLAGIRKSFWQNVVSGSHRVSFEIISKKDGISFFAIVPDELVTLVEKQINGAYPDAEIDLVDPEEVWDRGGYTATAELTLAGPQFYPIKVYEEMGSDTLNALTSVMSKLGEDEAVAIQYVISPASDGWRKKGQSYVGKIRAAQNNPEKNVNIDASFIEGVEKKIGKTGFKVVIRVISLANDKINAETHLTNIMSAFEQFTDAKYNKFKKHKFKRTKKVVEDFIYRRLSPFRNMAVLNIEEMATIFHFPNKDVQTPRIEWLESRKFPPPANLPEEGTYLGQSIFRGKEIDVKIMRADRRRHMYIIGQTGTGKSVQLMYMAAQDIQNGEGVCVIDPHGTDIQELLEKIPPERADDVILFNVADTKRPLGMNILQSNSEEERNQIINAFISLLYKIYDPGRTGMIGPQLERTVRNVMLTAMVDPEATMVDVMRMVIDESYSEKFLPFVKDPLVLRYWKDEVANTSASRKGETMGYFVSKFDRFITEKTLRNIIGQPKSALDFRWIMDNKKILLCDLSKGKIGEENAQFLGLLIVPKILAAAMSRHEMVEQGIDFPDFYLYVDEFQNFATPDFATILSEARKYKLNLIVANQFISQLTDEIKGAVFGNVGTKMAYRIGNDDAEYMEKEFEPVTKADLMGSKVGNYYTKLLVDGQPSNPFSVNMPWDVVKSQPTFEGISKIVIEKSRMTYGTDVAEVERLIDEKMGMDVEESEEEVSTGRDPKDIIKDLF